MPVLRLMSLAYATRTKRLINRISRNRRGLNGLESVLIIFDDFTHFQDAWDEFFTVECKWKGNGKQREDNRKV